MGVVPEMLKTYKKGVCATDKFKNVYFKTTSGFEQCTKTTCPQDTYGENNQCYFCCPKIVTGISENMFVIPDWAVYLAGSFMILLFLFAVYSGYKYYLPEIRRLLQKKFGRSRQSSLNGNQSSDQELQSLTQETHGDSNENVNENDNVNNDGGDSDDDNNAEVHPQNDINAEVHPQNDINAEVHPQNDNNAEVHPQNDINAEVHPQNDTFDNEQQGQANIATPLSEFRSTANGVQNQMI